MKRSSRVHMYIYSGEGGGGVDLNRGYSEWEKKRKNAIPQNNNLRCTKPSQLRTL